MRSDSVLTWLPFLSFAVAYLWVYLITAITFGMLVVGHSHVLVVSLPQDNHSDDFFTIHTQSGAQDACMCGNWARSVRPTDRPTERTSDRPTDRPADRPAGRFRMTYRQTDRATDRPTDRPGGRSADRPTDRVYVRNWARSVRPTDRPNERATDRPTDRLTGRPAASE